MPFSRPKTPAEQSPAWTPVTNAATSPPGGSSGSVSYLSLASGSDASLGENTLDPQELRRGMILDYRIGDAIRSGLSSPVSRDSRPRSGISPGYSPSPSSPRGSQRRLTSARHPRKTSLVDVLSNRMASILGVDAAGKVSRSSRDGKSDIDIGSAVGRADDGVETDSATVVSPIIRGKAEAPNHRKNISTRGFLEGGTTSGGSRRSRRRARNRAAIYARYNGPPVECDQCGHPRQAPGECEVCGFDGSRFSPNSSDSSN